MAARKPKKLDSEGLWSYALRSLAGRAHSVSELREKLRRRAEKPEDTAAILARLRERGYLDDRHFAEGFAFSRLGNQGFGKHRVLRDLRQRRVAPAVAERAVREAYQDTDEVELIESFLARKYRRVPLAEFLSEPKNLASAYRRLRVAGFSSSPVIRVLKRYAAEAESLETLDTEDDPGERLDAE